VQRLDAVRDPLQPEAELVVGDSSGSSSKIPAATVAATSGNRAGSATRRTLGPVDGRSPPALRAARVKSCASCVWARTYVASSSTVLACSPGRQPWCRPAPHPNSNQPAGSARPAAH
jgi:hypothetical protein